MAPLAMLLLMGLVVLGVMVTNQVQLTNAVRDGARAAAVCGSNPTGTTTLPDGSTPCTDTTSGSPDDKLTAWIISQANGSHGGVATVAFTVYNASHTAVGTTMSLCRKGYTVEVSTNYAQQIFVPLVGRWLGDGGGNTRTISAKAQATCEQ